MELLNIKFSINDHRKSVFTKVMILTILFFVSLPNLWAKPVSSPKARKAVQNWLRYDTKPLGSELSETVSNIETFSDSNGLSLYYVVHLEPEGFVIVAADDVIEPIIAFIEQGRYNPSDDRPLGALVSRDLPNRIKAAKKFEATADKGKNKNLSDFGKAAKKSKDKWLKLSTADDLIMQMGFTSVSDVRVAPFVQSKWGQRNVENYTNTDSCYNYYTPPREDGNNLNYPCGCVGTATAQVLRYHEYPVSYNWQDMPLVPLIGTPEYQRQAIGRLCRDTADAANTTFASGGSSGYVHDADENLINIFTYSNSIWTQSISVGTTLNEMVNPNLDAIHPVILGVNGPGGGHAVVCDGYGYNVSTLYHHLNMGWCGNDDAWYNLPTIDSSPSFSVVNECVYNIYTSGSGEIISGRVTNMVGNPIPGVTITASGPGTYQATTDDVGIYALAGVPSNQSFTVSANKFPYVFVNQNISTGTSTDSASTSGNKWGVNFSSTSEGPPIVYDQQVSVLSGITETINLSANDDGLPNPPGQLSYIIATLPNHGKLTDSGAGEITSVPYTLVSNGNAVEYLACSYFVGQDSFDFKANDYGSPPHGGDSESATVTIDVNNLVYDTFEPETNRLAPWPLKTSYEDCRTQVIYLSNEIGEAKTITDLALNVYSEPSQILNNWTIRMKHTTRTDYSSQPYLETSDWTIVYQNNESISSAGWRNFHFQNSFEYNGTDNLLIDFSYNNSYQTSDSNCRVSDTGSNRVLLSYCDSTHDDPLLWDDYDNPGLSVSSAVPNIKLISELPGGDPIVGDLEPDCDVDFADFARFSLAWQSIEGAGNWDPNCNLAEPNNKIDAIDLDALADNWLVQWP